MAHVFAKTLNSIKDQDHRLHAVASRNLSKAEAFRSEFDAHAAYESLEALAASDVDIIYVASPHLFHAKDMDIIIQGKKHILNRWTLYANTLSSFPSPPSPSLSLSLSLPLSPFVIITRHIR